MSSPAITRISASISYLASLDPANTSRNGSMTVAGRTLDVREIAGDFDNDCDECIDCCDEFIDGFITFFREFNRIAPQIIAGVRRLVIEETNSFLHFRSIDCQLLKRSFISMGNGATPEDINHNIEALTQLRDRLQAYNQVDEPRADALLNFHFRPETLVYSEGVIHRLDENFRQEILRECDVAIFFQQTLRVVNFFYNTFGINSHWLNQLLEDNRPTPKGTVRYTPGVIPLSVIEKSKKIETLVKQFDQLQELVDQLKKIRDAESEEANNLKAMLKELVDQLGCKEAEILEVKFFDVSELHKDIMLQIMTIPVFDRAHPDIQDQFETASEGTSIAINARAKRHAMDWRSFEAQFRSEMATIHGVRCTNCRHPMQRENMLIDTDLQDDILNFLSGKLPNALTAAVQP